MKSSIAAVVLVALTLAPARAADPLSSMRFLVGNWMCTYDTGKTKVTYKATFAYELGANWLRESDSWTGGGGDFGYFTYEPKRRSWTAVVFENERTTTIFRADGANPNRIEYRSVYPDATMSELFERTSPVRYVLHFTQHAGGKTIHSTDVCVKS